MANNEDVLERVERVLRPDGYSMGPGAMRLVENLADEVLALRSALARRDRVGVMGESMDFIPRMEIDALAAEVRELRRDRARLEDLAGRRAVVLAFFRSVIHCREPWTDKCQLEYDAAMGDGVS